MSLDRRNENIFEITRVLAVCATLAPYTTDEVRLFQSICDSLVGAGLFQLAWFGYAPGDTRRIADPVAWSGDDGFVQELRLAVLREEYEDPATCAISSREPFWIKHLLKHPGLGPMQAALERSGYTSVISLPVMSDHAYGALTLYYDDPEAYSQAAVSLLREHLVTLRGTFAAGPSRRPRSQEHETELRDLINVIPHNIGLLDASGLLLQVNQTMTDYTGYALPDLQLRGAFLKILHPDDYERVQLIYVAGYASGAPFGLEHQQRGKDGQYRWFLVNNTPIRNEEGRIIRWCAVGTDIEERKRAEDKIRQSEKEARQLLDLSPSHISELGPDWTRLYTNQASLKYYGLTLEEWKGADFQLLLHPQDAEVSARELRENFKSGLAFEYEARHKRNDGQYRWFHYRFSPMSNEEGRITRWYAAGTDIDDRKLAEQKLQQENVALREEIDNASMFEEIVGGSAPLKKVLSRVSKVAPTDSSVLITGETGTGKELVARAIHRRSRRSSYPFVSVNCAVIPRDLIASELFGHEKGAFTGATQRRLGRFELAQNGTVFLDEVGELPAETQIALLRVLQEREFERVGGSGTIRTDVRVIAATNRDLDAAIAAGTFRSDLYYRLNVFPIEMPTLRERKEDIPLLVTYFLNRYARRAGRHFTAVDKKSLDMLQSYAWPGNIRELQNVIERSVIVSETQTFSVDESWLSGRPSSPDPSIQPNLFNRPPAQEKALIEAALRECGGRVYGPAGAAAKLGIPRTTLETKIKSLKINKHRFKGEIS